MDSLIPPIGGYFGLRTQGLGFLHLTKIDFQEVALLHLGQCIEKIPATH